MMYLLFCMLLLEINYYYYYYYYCEARENTPTAKIFKNVC